MRLFVLHTKNKEVPFTTINFLKDLIKNIQEGKILTEYSHDNKITCVANHVCMNFDCSGFVYYYYTKIGLSEALNEIIRFITDTKKIPRGEIKKIYAAEFHLFAEHIVRNYSKHWTRVQNPEQLAHGDLIIYTTTGTRQNHCMLVNRVINVQNRSATLQIVDSTQYPHKNDTRSASQNGLGMGEITLYKSNTQWNAYRHNRYIYKGHITMMRIK